MPCYESENNLFKSLKFFNNKINAGKNCTTVDLKTGLINLKPCSESLDLNQYFTEKAA